MNIKEKLESREYDFLRTNERIKNNTMLLTLGGSLAYGTNVDYIDPDTGNRYISDIDLRGILSENPNEIIGLSKFEQFENKTTDTVLYGFSKMIKLLLNCNPNVIEILGTKPEHIFHLSEEGKMLKDNTNIFLTLLK